MRFKTIAFALIVSSAVFILGCDDEDSSTIGGGGRLSFQVNGDTIQITVQSGGALLTSQLGYSQFTTDEIAVTKGQNVLVTLQPSSGNCKNRQVKAFLNGSQFDARTFNLGLPGFQVPQCTDGYILSYNLIIP